MTNSFWQVPPDSTGKKLDSEQLTIGSNTVERQRIVTITPAQLNAELGRYFTAPSAEVAATTAGQVLGVLENPAGSGKKVHIDFLRVGTNSATSAATVILNGTRTGGDAVTPINLNGGTASASVFSTPAVGTLAYTGGTLLTRDRIVSGINPIPFDGKLVLAAGSSVGIIVTPVTANPYNAVNFAWWEI